MQYFFFPIHTNNFLGVLIHILIYILLKHTFHQGHHQNEKKFFFELLENFMSFKMCQTQQIKKFVALCTHTEIERKFYESNSKRAWRSIS